MKMLILLCSLVFADEFKTEERHYSYEVDGNVETTRVTDHEGKEIWRTRWDPKLLIEISKVEQKHPQGTHTTVTYYLDATKTLAKYKQENFKVDGYINTDIEECELSNPTEAVCKTNKENGKYRYFLCEAKGKKQWLPIERDWTRHRSEFKYNKDCQQTSAIHRGKENSSFQSTETRHDQNGIVIRQVERTENKFSFEASEIIYDPNTFREVETSRSSRIETVYFDNNKKFYKSFSYMESGKEIGQGSCTDFKTSVTCIKKWERGKLDRKTYRLCKNPDGVGKWLLETVTDQDTHWDYYSNYEYDKSCRLIKETFRIRK